MRYNPNNSILAGVSRDTLTLWLTQAQQAMADLMMGAKVVTVSYEGKNVSYTPADSAKLTEWIAMLQAQLSGKRTRRALRPYF